MAIATKVLTIQIDDGELWFDGEPAQIIVGGDDATARVLIDDDDERTVERVGQAVIRLLSTQRAATHRLGDLLGDG